MDKASVASLPYLIGRPLYSKMSFPWNSFGEFGRGCTILFLKHTVGDSVGTGMLLHLVLLLMPFDHALASEILSQWLSSNLKQADLIVARQPALLNPFSLEINYLQIKLTPAYQQAHTEGLYIES